MVAGGRRRARRRAGRRAAGRGGVAVASHPTLTRQPGRGARVDAPATRTPASSSACRAPWRSATTTPGSTIARALPAFQDQDGLLEVLPDPGAGQRGADRLRRVAWPTPPAAPCPPTFRDGMLGALGRLRRRLAATRVAHGRPAAAQAGGARRPGAPRQGDRGAGRDHRGRARAVADVGAARLVERAAARARGARSRTRASPRSRRSCARGSISPARCCGSRARRPGRSVVAHDGTAVERRATRPAGGRGRRRARDRAQRWRDDLPKPGARRARAAARRALGHDHRERLGHAGDRALRGGLRDRAGHGYDDGHARRPARERSPGRGSRRRRRSSWRGRPPPPDLTVEQAGHGRALGHGGDRAPPSRCARRWRAATASPSTSSRSRSPSPAPGTAATACASGSRSRPRAT